MWPFWGFSDRYLWFRCCVPEFRRFLRSVLKRPKRGDLVLCDLFSRSSCHSSLVVKWRAPRSPCSLFLMRLVWISLNFGQKTRANCTALMCIVPRKCTSSDPISLVAPIRSTRKNICCLQRCVYFLLHHFHFVLCFFMINNLGTPCFASDETTNKSKTLYYKPLQISKYSYASGLENQKRVTIGGRRNQKMMFW